MPGEEFCSAKIFQVLVVDDNVNQSQCTLQVVLPRSEYLEDSKEFLIVDVVVQLREGECLRVKCYQMNFVVDDNGGNGAESVVGGIGLDDDLSI